MLVFVADGWIHRAFRNNSAEPKDFQVRPRYEKPTGVRAGSSARPDGADSRRKGGRLQSARGPASRVALVVAGDGLKRKRIVRTAEVTIETEESVVLRGSANQHAALMWCPVCRREVEMVTPEQAAQISGVTTRTIYRWIESGKLHFREARNASLLICRPALSDSFRQSHESGK